MAQWRPGEMRPDEQNPFSHGSDPPPAAPGPYQRRPDGQWTLASAPRRSRAPLVIVLVVAVVVVLCGGFGAGGYLLYRHRSGDGGGSGATGSAGDRGHPAGALGMGKPWTVGNPRGGHRVQIFEDFGCRYCKSTHAAIQPVIDGALADGTDRWAFDYYPVAITGTAAERAANAFACAGEVGSATERDALDYQDAIFSHQHGEGGGFTNGSLIKMAPRVFTDSGAFTACVRSDRYGEWVRSLSETMKKRKVTGTPTVFVDGHRLSSDELTGSGFRTALGG